jgi:pimeloyl-ACP methyl ester carboxylesterase
MRFCRPAGVLTGRTLLYYVEVMAHEGPGGTNNALRGTAERRATFRAAYDAMMVNWPVPAAVIDLESDFGSTRVTAGGPAGAPALLLLHAYQASSAEWIQLARELGDEMRVCAVDLPGDAGASAIGRRPIVTPADMVSWLDTVIDGLGVPSAELCGHSYGGWIALTYALQRPASVDRVTLLDPTMSFAPLIPKYVIRALPTMLKPTAARRRSLIRWESRGAGIDPDWLALTSVAADAFGGAPTVPTKVPPAQVVSRLEPPALVIVAGRGRVHLPRKVMRRAQQRLPDARVGWIPDATHYGLPLTHAAEIAALMRSPQ